MIVRFAPALAVIVLSLPVLAGLAGTVLPAFGYLPVLGGDHFSIEHFQELFSQPGISRSAIQAFYVGLVSTLISVGLVAGFVSAWHGTRAFRTVQHLVSPLLAVPHAAAAFGFAFMIAPSGFLARLVSPWLTGWQSPPDWLIVNDPAGLALIAGLVAKETPFILLVTLAALPQVPARRSAMVTGALGYGRMTGFFLAVWPQIYRQIRLAVFAVIAYASSNVDMSIILGPTTPQLLPVRLVHWMNDPDLTRRFMACAGACLQILVTSAALLAWIGLERMGGVLHAMSAGRGRRFVDDGYLRALTAALMTASALIVFGGLAMLAIWSVAGLWQFPDVLPGKLSGRSWAMTWPSAIGPLQTTIIIGLFSVLIAIAITLGSLARETATGRAGGQRAMAILYLPLLVPQIGFLFGLQLLLLSANANATWPALVMAHVIFVLPYVFLSLSAPWRAHDRRYDEIAASFGASSARIFWRIRFPMLLRAILAAAAVGFAVSVGQYLPTLLVGSGRFPTITTEAIALGAGGNRRIIGIYAFLQMVLPFVGFALASIIPGLLFMNRRAIRGT